MVKTISSLLFFEKKKDINFLCVGSVPPPKEAGGTYGQAPPPAMLEAAGHYGILFDLNDTCYRDCVTIRFFFFLAGSAPPAIAEAGGQYGTAPPPAAMEASGQYGSFLSRSLSLFILVKFASHLAGWLRSCTSGRSGANQSAKHRLYATILLETELVANRRRSGADQGGRARRHCAQIVDAQHLLRLLQAGQRSATYIG
jgi:hypothetical protein